MAKILNLGQLCEVIIEFQEVRPQRQELQHNILRLWPFVTPVKFYWVFLGNSEL